MSAERLEATAVINAPAAQIFALIAHPDGHVAIDGSGMLVAAKDAQPLQGVGDSFTIDMERAPIGDPASYTMVNTVTVFDQDRELAWTPAREGGPTAGHVFGFRLEPAGADATTVTNYYDWSNISDAARERLTWPVIKADMLDRSLENLQRAVS